MYIFTLNNEKIFFITKYFLIIFTILIQILFSTPCFSSTILNCENLFLNENEYSLPKFNSIEKLIHKIPELVAIKKIAETEGIRVWIFGGAASTLLNFSLKKNPNSELDFYDLFQTGQDIDLVINGSEEKAHILQIKIDHEFPLFRGAKSIWEVIPLKYDWESKKAVLGESFRTQHTDTWSIGLVELTTPPTEEARVRDFINWENKKNSSRFREDLQNGVIRFIKNPKHLENSKYLQGDNPELFSVIRFLNKVTRHNLPIHPEDLIEIKKISSAFIPEEEIRTPYAKMWLKNNLIKMILQAENLEILYGLLDTLELRNKLMGIWSITERESPSWYLAKQPLKSFTVGMGAGKTAAELGISLVEHHAGSSDAYMSILADPTNLLNAFESRQEGQSQNETAAHGNGFYTSVGVAQKNVFWERTGYKIDIQINPKARENSDFKLVDLGNTGGKIILLLNKKAGRIIRGEKPDIFNYLDEIETHPTDHINLGLIYRWKRSHSTSGLSESEQNQITKRIEKVLKIENTSSEQQLLLLSLAYIAPDNQKLTLLRRILKNIEFKDIPSILRYFSSDELMISLEAKNLLLQTLDQIIELRKQELGFGNNLSDNFLIKFIDQIGESETFLNSPFVIEFFENFLLKIQEAWPIQIHFAKKLLNHPILIRNGTSEQLIRFIQTNNVKNMTYAIVYETVSNPIFLTFKDPNSLIDLIFDSEIAWQFELKYLNFLKTDPIKNKALSHPVYRRLIAKILRNFINDPKGKYYLTEPLAEIFNLPTLAYYNYDAESAQIDQLISIINNPSSTKESKQIQEILQEE